MVKHWAVLYTLAVTAGAVVVQGASLAARDEPCTKNDHGHLKCETSGGSPLVADCKAAIASLSDDDICYNSNAYASHCTTIGWHGTCKIDACGQGDSTLYTHGVWPDHPNPGCKTYLNNLLNGCKSGKVVGGQNFPQKCSVNYNVGLGIGVVDDPHYKDPMRYHVQFSHA